MRALVGQRASGREDRAIAATRRDDERRGAAADNDDGWRRATDGGQMGDCTTHRSVANFMSLDQQSSGYVAGDPKSADGSTTNLALIATGSPLAVAAVTWRNENELRAASARVLIQCEFGASLGALIKLRLVADGSGEHPDLFVQRVEVCNAQSTARNEMDIYRCATWTLRLVACCQAGDGCGQSRHDEASSRFANLHHFMPAFPTNRRCRVSRLFLKACAKSCQLK